MQNVLIAINYVKYDDVKKEKNQNLSIELLKRSPNWVCPVSFGYYYDKFNKNIGIETLNILERDSSIEIHNDRSLPYIKEIFELCEKVNCDVFGYINSDILIGEEFYNLIQEGYDCFILPRNDIAETNVNDFLNDKVKIIYGGDQHCGVDGFFFNKKWWKDNKDKFPDDLILGETEWDTCYREIIKSNSDNYIEKRILYHVYHDQKWTLNSNGAINNTKIWDEIRTKYWGD